MIQRKISTYIFFRGNQEAVHWDNGVPVRALVDVLGEKHTEQGKVLFWQAASLKKELNFGSRVDKQSDRPT
jgi:hypothetical protein